MVPPADSSPACEPVAPKVEICTCHNPVHSELVPSSCVNHSSTATRESRTVGQCMLMIKHTCSFAVQTQIDNKSTKELPSTADEDNHCADVTTEEDTTSKTEKKTQVQHTCECVMQFH